MAPLTGTQPTAAARTSSTFCTLEREHGGIFPSKKGTPLPHLHELIRPHLDSFNAIKSTNDGRGKGLLELAVSDLDRRDIKDSFGNKLEFWIESVAVALPRISDANTKSVDKRLFPTECRERGITYAGQMTAKIGFSVNGNRGSVDNRSLGALPLMVKSTFCHLHGLSPYELIQRHEEAEELGGYFIVNGIERLIRLLIVNRRNHPMAIVRPSFQKRGPTYTHYGVMMRCARPDQTSHTITIHYLNDGNTTLRFTYRKQEYMLPLVMVLKALISTTDKEIYDSLVQSDTSNTFVTDRVELMLRGFKRYHLYTQEQCLAFLGSKFRVALGVSEDMDDAECGEFLLRKIVLVHLSDNRDKFNMLIFMLQKLYALVAGECAPDNPDSPQHQEVLLGGFLYAAIIKEKLDDFLTNVKYVVQQELRKNPSLDFQDGKAFHRILLKTPCNIGRMLEYFLATGNLISNTGMDLSQASGYTIVAEKLNYYRYIAHFRSIHRGAFFAELKTTAVRKLLPESWGFLCPVHTPDGSPCGLLNHLSHTCKVLTKILCVDGIPALCASLGMTPLLPGRRGGILGKNEVKILLDGRVIGTASPTVVETIARELRRRKVLGLDQVPLELELGLVPLSHGGQFAGLYMFSQPSRFIRPVKFLENDRVDMLGSFEQVFMDIACLDEDIVPGVTVSQELEPTNMLSVIANLTPFSDFNQSPRNMYQCQMGKQSMGTPAIALSRRTDNKLYRLMTGQTPIVRPKLHNQFGMDNYPNGMNAIVAVISYTGYDMEDAMIINKSSYERGFGHGLIYKSEFVDLSEFRQRGEPILHHFGCPDPERLGKGKLDCDGLPLLGVKLTNGDPYYSYVNDTTGQCKVVRYKGLEDAIVEEVRLCGNESGKEELQKINIKLRIPRNPIIGDKFSSRHGQKGVCSQRFPTVDLPFTESGMVPDVIINPHAFPSRMTIGMFVESMAAKAGALHGICQDATPFCFNEDETAVDYFGKQLAKAGYNYYGNEPMYSGITGREMQADIYIGVVYYQRLRHMVSDKYQVRTTGPIDNLTHQPVKGRKRAGGIRFGEMERDSLLAHGVSFCLQDRLMNCSDYSIAHVCRLCGSILSPTAKLDPVHGGLLSGSGGNAGVEGPRDTITCRTCQKSDGIDVIAIPYVFRYLATELLAMNIRMTLTVR